MSTIEKSSSFIDVSVVSSERLEAELCQFAADLSAGTARWLMMVAEYDRRRVWEQWECRSMAYWLVGHCGVSLITARQYVHVAQTVEKFPSLWAEFLAGGLSYSRVRALCRFITPSSEADLVRMAKFCTAPQLERLAASVDRAAKLAAPGDDDDQFDRRALHLFVNEDGTWSIRGRLPAEIGTALRVALDTEISHQQQTEKRQSQEREPQQRESQQRETGKHDAAASLQRRGAEGTAAQRRVDALYRLIEHGHVALSHLANADSNVGDDDARVRPLLVVHRYPDGDELQNGPAITSATAERLSCNADVTEATHNAGPDQDLKSDEPGITFGPRRRLPNRAMRRALKQRDQGCRFTGCCRKGKLQPHHIIHYANNGATTIRNLIMLCPFHHHAIHHRGWTITGNPSSQLAFTRTAYEPTRPRKASIETVVDLATETGTPRICGDRFDLALIVSTYLHNERIAHERNLVDA
jgi:anti-sigma28 factor (negative regulator of flagellin synthesis)